MALHRTGPGRPPKYGRPSRVVTLTLPEDVIARLVAFDADLGRAIVGLTESKSEGLTPTRPVEINSYGRHAIIVVTAVRTLKRLQGVQLVPIGRGRALISLDPPHSIPRFEVDVRDVLERDEVKGDERQALEGIADVLRQARRSGGARLQERTIIVLESRRPRGPNGHKRSRATSSPG